VTYPDNPPISGGPDEVVPAGGLSDTGIAALAGKTQQDWEDELFGGVQGKIDPLAELFAVVTETFIGIVDKIVEVFSGFVDLDAAINTLDDILQFFYNVADRSGVLGVLEDLYDIVENIGGTFFTLLEDIVGWFGSVINLPNIDDLDGFLAVLGQVIDFFAGIAGNIRDGFLETLETVVNWLLTIAGLENVDSLADFLGIVEDIVSFFGSILNLPAWTEALKTLIDGILSVVNLPLWVSTLTTLINGLLDVPAVATFVNVLKTLVNWFTGIAEAARVPFLNILQDIVEGLGAVLNVPLFMTNLKTLIDGLGSGIANLSTWVETVKTFINGLVGTVNLSTFVDVLVQIIEFFMTIADNIRAGFLTALETVVTTFQGLFVGGTLTDWLNGIPQFGQALVDGLWSALNGGATAIGKTIEDALEAVGAFATGLIQNITGNPAADAVGDLATWAGNLLTKGLSWDDLLQIFGEIPERLLGVLPIPQLSLVSPELMSQGGFDTSTSLAAGSGWSWDSTQRYPTTATTGGSAKVQGGATRALYAQQSISVAEGDKLVVTCFAKSSSSVSANSIKIDVIEIRGDGTTVERPIAAMGTSTNWVALGNDEDNPYVVGSGVTAIRVKIGTTSGVASNRYVWFDAISVRKVGLMPGDWVGGLLGGNIIENVLYAAGQVVQGILGSVPGIDLDEDSDFSIAGAFTTFFETLFGPFVQFLPPNLASNPLLQAAIPGLNADKIVDGTLNADFLPMSDIGVEILPTQGSGALLVRTTNGAVNAKANYWNTVQDGFFNSLAVASDDIQCLRSNGVAATGTQVDYAGAFRVTIAGWYMVELAFKTEPVASWGWNFAPVLFKGSTLPSVTGNGSTSPPASAYKVGTDVLYTWAEAPAFPPSSSGTNRFVQNSWIVYLQANEIVRAGYNVDIGAALGRQMLGSSSGSSVAETYFSISLLNKSYA